MKSAESCAIVDDALLPVPFFCPRTHSEKKRGRVSGRKMALADSPSLNGLWPTVIDSSVTPMFWMDDA